jgi:hypothetical protein
MERNAITISRITHFSVLFIVVSDCFKEFRSFGAIPIGSPLESKLLRVGVESLPQGVVVEDNAHGDLVLLSIVAAQSFQIKPVF